MHSTSFKPEDSLVKMLAAGYAATQTTNQLGNGRQAVANPHIQTVEDYIDSLKNTQVSRHREAYAKAIREELRKGDSAPVALNFGMETLQAARL